MTAIDSFTNLSPGFYEEFLRAGDSARRRGQHFRVRGPDGSMTLRLAGGVVCRCQAIAVTASSSFRTVGVVPRSHSNGMFERLRGIAGEPCTDPDIAAQALPLDLRPSNTGSSSSLVVWDSRLLTGHARITKPSRHRTLKPWRPSVSDEGEQKRSLVDNGYAVLADVLPQEEMDEALRRLLLDIQLLEPSVPCLCGVRKWHLPPERRGKGDLRDGVLRHGQFARFFQARPSIARAMARLVGMPAGISLTSVVAAVALAPPAEGGPGRGSRTALRHGFAGPRAPCWKACLQLFPGNSSAGGSWERIAVMFCVAPSVDSIALCADHSLRARVGAKARRKRNNAKERECIFVKETLAIPSLLTGQIGIVASKLSTSNAKDPINDILLRAGKLCGDPPVGVSKRLHRCSADKFAGCSAPSLYLGFGVGKGDVPAKRSKT